MADDTVTIDVKTTTDTSGLEKAGAAIDSTRQKVQDLNKVTSEQAETALSQAKYEQQAAREAEAAADAQEKAGRAAQTAADGTARKWKTVGNVIRGVVTGDLSAAAAGMSELGGKFIALGGAAGAAIASWTMAARLLVDKIREHAKAVDEIKFNNLEASAKSLSDRFDDIATRIEKAKTAAESLAAAGEAVKDAETTARIAEINAQRRQELTAAGGDQEAAARINAKFDVQVAGVTREREQGRIAAANAQRERERATIQEQMQALDKRDQDYQRQLASVSPQIESSHETFTDYNQMNPLFRFGGNMFTLGGLRRKATTSMDTFNRMRGVQSSALQGLSENELARQGLQGQLAQLEAQAPVQAAQERASVAAYSGALSGASGLVAQADQIRAQREAEQAQKAAREREDAQALADAEQQQIYLRQRRSGIVGEAEAGQAAASEAERAAALAQNRLAAEQSRWAGSTNTRQRDVALSPLQQAAGETTQAANAAQQQAARTMQSTKEAVREIDSTLRSLEGEINRIKNRMAASRGDIQA